MNPDYTLRDQLLQVMIDNNASDLYITLWSYPALKISWDITKINLWLEEMTKEDTKNFAQSLISPEQHEELLKTQNLDFSFGAMGARFRGNISFQMNSYMVVVRLLNTEIPSLDTLGLPDIYKDITKKGQGLVLVTGPTGSWKTTTLAAMMQYINQNYKKHIITIEDPIEYIHKHSESIVEQKEVGRDVPDYETALIGAMRQAPHVILFGEMRNRREMEMALTLAETGHLVFSTLHTRSTYQTITRIIDTFWEGEKDQIRIQLADALAAVFSQRLLKMADGTAVQMVKEVLVNNNAISNLIRENDLHQIPTAIQMGKRDGMQLLEDDIINLIQTGIISQDEGLKYANNPRLIKEL